MCLCVCAYGGYAMGQIALYVFVYLCICMYMLCQLSEHVYIYLSVSGVDIHMVTFGECATSKSRFCFHVVINFETRQGMDRCICNLYD